MSILIKSATLVDSKSNLNFKKKLASTNVLESASHRIKPIGLEKITSIKIAKKYQKPNFCTFFGKNVKIDPLKYLY